MNKETNKTKDNFNVMVKEIAKYIKIHGGNVVVIGGIGIREKPPKKYSYTFEIDFIGKPPKRVK